MLHPEIRYRARLALAALGMLALGAANILMYRAGCIGDTKTGLFGDPAAALVLEGAADLILLTGLMLLALFFGTTPRKPMLSRIRDGLTMLLLGAVVCWFVGLSLEGWAVRECFAGAHPNSRWSGS